MIRPQQPKSLAVTIYNGELQPVLQSWLPLSVASPAINRIVNGLPSHELARAKELWYFLVPSRPGSGVRFQRASTPVGECSLYGGEYIAQQAPPPRVSHHPQPLVEFFGVTIKDFDDEIFSGHFSVNDLFHAGVEFLARRMMEKGTLLEGDLPLFYDVDLSLKSASTFDQNLFPEDAYQVEGIFTLPRRESSRKRIVFRQVASPPIAQASRASFGASQLLGRGKKRRGTVLLRPNVYRELLEVTLSDTVENGEFLLGNIYRTPHSAESEDDPNFNWTVEVTDVLLAEGAHGTPATLQFTGNTWCAMRRRMARDFPDRILVSWFHTHLFAANDDFGLSGRDQELHRKFFCRPWHVAILINIDSNQQREVRCFQKSENGDLVECRFEVLEDPVAPSPSYEAGGMSLKEARPVRIQFRYNKDSGAIEDLLVDDNSPDAAEAYHDKIAELVARQLGSHAVIHDVGSELREAATETGSSTEVRGQQQDSKQQDE